MFDLFTKKTVSIIFVLFCKMFGSILETITSLKMAAPLFTFVLKHRKKSK